MNHYNPIKLMAAVLGGIGMFGTLSVFKRVLFGPPAATVDLIGPIFISGCLIGAAWVLVDIAAKRDRE
jgi:hypothetical protein